MNRNAITTFLLSFLLTTGSALATPGYLGTSISELDMLGCHNDSKNPRCKKIVKVACKTICTGRDAEDDELLKACKELCQLPLNNNASKKNEPTTRFK